MKHAGQPIKALLDVYGRGNSRRAEKKPESHWWGFSDSYPVARPNQVTYLESFWSSQGPLRDSDVARVQTDSSPRPFLEGWCTGEREIPRLWQVIKTGSETLMLTQSTLLWNRILLQLMTDGTLVQVHSMVGPKRPQTHFKVNILTSKRKQR